MGKGALGVASAFDIFPSPIFFSSLKKKREVLWPQRIKWVAPNSVVSVLLSSSPCMSFSALPWFAQWVVWSWEGYCCTFQMCASGLQKIDSNRLEKWGFSLTTDTLEREREFQRDKNDLWVQLQMILHRLLIDGVMLAHSRKKTELKYTWNHFGFKLLFIETERWVHRNLLH